MTLVLIPNNFLNKLFGSIKNVRTNYIPLEPDHYSFVDTSKYLELNLHNRCPIEHNVAVRDLVCNNGAFFKMFKTFPYKTRIHLRVNPYENLFENSNENYRDDLLRLINSNNVLSSVVTMDTRINGTFSLKIRVKNCY